MKKDNYQRLVQEFLEKLRLDVKSSELSKRLDYNFNIYSRWETGTKIFYWKDFVKLAGLFDKDIKKTIELTFMSIVWGGLADNEILDMFINSHTMPIDEVISKKKIQRIKSGERNLTFIEFLSIFEALTSRSVLFLNSFLKKEDHIKFNFRVKSKEFEELYNRDIYVLLILNIFELDSYKSLDCHSNEFVADLLNISNVDVEIRIRQLENYAVVSKNEKELYVVDKDAFSDVVFEKKYSNIVHNFWRKMVYERSLLDSKKKYRTQRGLHVLYKSNPELDKKVIDLTSRFYNDFRLLVKETEQGDSYFDRIEVLAINLFNPLEYFKCFSDSEDRL